MLTSMLSSVDHLGDAVCQEELGGPTGAVVADQAEIGAPGAIPSDAEWVGDERNRGNEGEVLDPLGFMLYRLGKSPPAVVLYRLLRYNRIS